MNNHIFFRTASLDLLFSNYIHAFDVFNNIINKTSDEDKERMLKFKNQYKTAIKNIDLKGAKNTLKKSSEFVYEISKKGYSSPQRLEEEVVVKPYNQYANRHLWARDVIRVAFKKLMGRYPTLAEEQLAQAVGLHESSYGAGWKGSGKGSNNWGAVQCCTPKNGQCPANTFLYTDTSPQKDGTSKKYSVCFKSYPDAVSGAYDMLKNIFKAGHKGRGDKTQIAAQTGSIPLFSSVMYDTSYYQGFGPDRKARISSHVKAMQRNLKAISKATGVSLAVSGDQEAIPTEEQTNQFLATTEKSTTENHKTMTQVPIQNNELEQEYKSLMNNLFASNETPEEKSIKKAILKEKLPCSRHLLSIDDGSFEFRVRLANVLTTAFRNYFDAETSIHSDGKDKIELEVDILGSKEASAKAIKAVAAAVGNIFNDVVKENMESKLYINKSSSLPLLDTGVSERCFRKFALRTW